VSLKEGRDGTGSTEKIEKEETKETTKGGRKVVKDGRNEGRIGAKKRKKRRKDWCGKEGREERKKHQYSVCKFSKKYLRADSSLPTCTCSCLLPAVTMPYCRAENRPVEMAARTPRPKDAVLPWLGFPTT
jgi:hypothetical protein